MRALRYTAPEIAWPWLVYDCDRLVGFIMGVPPPADRPDIHPERHLAFPGVSRLP